MYSSAGVFKVHETLRHLGVSGVLEGTIRFEWLPAHCSPVWYT